MARFLADESCDAVVVLTLRRAGYDLVVVSERCPGADDSQVISIAGGERRILLTEDKDFGQLVFASGYSHCGVVLLRYPFRLRREIAAQLVGLIKECGESLIGCFVVLQPGRSRILRPPLLA